ncbi:CaiB/BaiF CoA transferase family protein [Hydrogenophaga taeniospiralis]|uniref:CaiB/BaiF CoA transferase family protein n=1 Tax=Hydrogenophaga taeniospiralis TaxID=65656 RepID=UPI001CFC329F|nr:CaiB/BaiF CoA-transferase family protein [Hydrogenophaga taeniospiralis]
MMRAGPLSHLTVVELAGLGPAPFAAMMLADQGARVIRVDRPIKPGQASGMGALTARKSDVLSRGRESIALDLKSPEGQQTTLALIARADILIEGFRPGVMESLGIGPEVCLKLCPSLVYGRVTGWGQTGPLSQAAGHDINYVALSGALHSNRRAGEAPTVAPGLIGDFGGGGMLLAFGVLAALAHAKQTGEGQVVDAAITDGAALLTALIQGWHSAGLWSNEAGTNNGDGGAHFYNTYQCADGKCISIGPMEPQFYKLLREKCNLHDPLFDAQWDSNQWPTLKAELSDVFSKKTRQQWCELLEGTDVCFAPVLDLDEAPGHPHNISRGTFVTVEGITQPAPAPKFGLTPAAPCQSVGEIGRETNAILNELRSSALESGRG